MRRQQQQQQPVSTSYVPVTRAAVQQHLQKKGPPTAVASSHFALAVALTQGIRRTPSTASCPFLLVLSGCAVCVVSWTMWFLSLGRTTLGRISRRKLRNKYSETSWDLLTLLLLFGSIHDSFMFLLRHWAGGSELIFIVRKVRSDEKTKRTLTVHTHTYSE